MTRGGGIKGRYTIVRLIICGNGLDLHLEFNTQYSNYCQYLKDCVNVSGEMVTSIIENSPFFTRALQGDQRWTDLEMALTFDCEQYIGAMKNVFDRNLSPYDPNVSRQQIEAAQAFQKVDPSTFASDFTNRWFNEWICNEYYSNYERIAHEYNGIARDIITCDNIFVTFNYTPTLEDVFGIPRDRILYIHNRFPDREAVSDSSTKELLEEALESGQKKFQFGSTQNDPAMWNELCENIVIDGNGGLLQKKQVVNNIRRICAAFTKNLSDNYDALRNFIKNNDVDEIVIMGHSFTGIDYPYYKDVIIPLFGDRHWTIFWYSELDKNNAMEFVNANNITRYELVQW